MECFFSKKSTSVAHSKVWPFYFFFVFFFSEKVAPVAPENPTEAEILAETKRVYAEFAKNPTQDAFFAPLETNREHVLKRMNYSEEHMNMVPEDVSEKYVFLLFLRCTSTEFFFPAIF